MTFEFIDGLVPTNPTGNNTEGRTEKGVYHNVLSKVPMNSDTRIYWVNGTYYVVYEQIIDGETYHAFWTYTDEGGPGTNEFINMEDSLGNFTRKEIIDGTGLFTEDYIAQGIHLGEANTVPSALQKMRNWDPFAQMNMNAEKFVAKWGKYFTPEYDEVLDVIFRSAITGQEISRENVTAALPPGQEFNWRLLDATNARITGPGAIAVWEADSKEALDVILSEFSGNFEFDEPQIYDNLLQLWTHQDHSTGIINEDVLRKVVEKMFLGTKDPTFDTYFDTIKNDIYSEGKGIEIDYAKNRGLVSKDIESIVGGAAGDLLKEDKDKMNKWQQEYNSTEGQDKVKQELQRIWDAGAPEELVGSNAYNQHLNFSSVMNRYQGKSYDITHSVFDDYKYLSTAEMGKLSRKKGLEDGIAYTQNLLKESLGKNMDIKYGEKF